MESTLTEGEYRLFAAAKAVQEKNDFSRAAGLYRTAMERTDNLKKYAAFAFLSAQAMAAGAESEQLQRLVADVSERLCRERQYQLLLSLWTRFSAVHPVFALTAWAGVGIGLERLLPMRFLPAIAESLIAKPVLFAGIVLTAWSMFEFWRHGTSLDHSTPTTTLVTSGPFRFSRNPVYVGFVLLMLGFSMSFRSLWALLLITPATFAIQRLTVSREEAYLEQEFGEDYVLYRRSVRRWL